MKGNPRYALVRVDGTTHCPSRYEKINRNFVCSGLPHCYKCRYGDTKEQLIRKIAQVFSMEKIIVAKTLDEYKYKLAKEIVEFLGVE